MLKNATFFQVVGEEEVSEGAGDDLYDVVDDLYDVEFRFNKEEGGFKGIRTVKSVLAFTSPVFKQQFFGSLSARKRSQEEMSTGIEVVTVEGFAFNLFKDFIELITS